MTHPKVSIIIPAYNEEKTIEVCIQSLLGLTYPKNRYEILIVDNNSTDDTPQIIQKYEVLYLREKNQSPAAARNLGIKKAKGEIIAFIDADCVADKNWLINLIKGFNTNTKIAGVGGKIRVFRPSNMIEKFGNLHLYNQNKFVKGTEGQLPFLASGNCAYKTGILKKVGLFDTSFITSEDNDLGWRVHFLGYQLAYAPKAIVYHQMPKTLFLVLKRQFIYGRDNARLIDKHRKYLKKHGESSVNISRFIVGDIVKLPRWFKKVFISLMPISNKNKKERILYLLTPFLDFLIYTSFRLGMIYQTLKTGKNE
jgi:cellulose synthase/poly-beta-1,6-N-acetylglucosamine synthase-like glycosyltransferase